MEKESNTWTKKSSGDIMTDPFQGKQRHEFIFKDDKELEILKTKFKKEKYKIWYSRMFKTFRAVKLT